MDNKLVTAATLSRGCSESEESFALFADSATKPENATQKKLH